MHVSSKDCADNAWGAYHSALQKKSGIEVKQAIGPACGKCLRIALDHMRFPTWRAFMKAMEEDTDGTWEEKFKLIEQREANGCTAKPSWRPHSSSCRSIITVETSKTYRGYSEQALKKRLNCTRLSQRTTAPIAEVVCPSLVDPKIDQVVYLFKALKEYPDDDEGLDITVRAARTYDESSEIVPFTANLFEEHAQKQMLHEMYKDERMNGVFSVAAKNPQAFLDFVAAYDGHIRKSSLAARASSGTVSGALAGEIELLAEDKEEGGEHLQADLSEQQAKSQLHTPRKSGSGLLSDDASAGTPGGDGDHDLDDDDDDDDSG